MNSTNVRSILPKIDSVFDVTTVDYPTNITLLATNISEQINYHNTHHTLIDIEKVHITELTILSISNYFTISKQQITNDLNVAIKPLIALPI